MSNVSLYSLVHTIRISDKWSSIFILYILHASLISKTNRLRKLRKVIWQNTTSKAMYCNAFLYFRACVVLVTWFYFFIAETIPITRKLFILLSYRNFHTCPMGYFRMNCCNRLSKAVYDYRTIAPKAVFFITFFSWCVLGISIVVSGTERYKPYYYRAYWPFSLLRGTRAALTWKSV